MNYESNPNSAELLRNSADQELTEPVYPPSEEELRSLAEDIVRYCPSLTHLLLALGSKSRSNPLEGMN